MTGVEEAVGRLALYCEPGGSHYAEVEKADVRTLLSALSEMQADISGKGGRVVSEEVVERAARAHCRARGLEFRRSEPGREVEAMRAALATLPPAPEEVAGLIAEANDYAERIDVHIGPFPATNKVRTLLRSLATALAQATTAGVGR